MKYDEPSAVLFDAHAHLSFASDPVGFAQWANERFAGAFSTTVDLADYRASNQAFGFLPKIKIGLGAHPWWVAQGKITSEDLEELALLAQEARFIGEVGLDFGKNGLAKSAFVSAEETKAAQVSVLRSILAACAESGDPAQSAGRGRVFSFHAVRSADVIMDLLQELGLLPGNTVIFHWFSGSSAQLTRARDLGCSFSVNAFMLATKRGREYAKAIPTDRLFVETDLPEGPADQFAVPAGEESFAWEREQYERALVSAYEQLIELRGPGILEAIERNVATTFGA